jgi:large subunit ribosomal protein L10
LREADGGLQIVKNTLLRRALEDAGRPVPVEQLEGPVAMGYATQELPPVAKVLSEFAKETSILQIRGAILGTNILDPDGVQALADLPSREVLLAQLVGSVQGPMSSLVSTISAPLRELAQVLKARGEQGQEAAA